MSQAPILLFLHGVTTGDEPDSGWEKVLDETLTALGYRGLAGVDVVAPRYPNGLRGIDDDEPLPKVTVKSPRGDAGKRNRRDFERRRTAMEIFLGPDDRGDGLFAGDQATPLMVRLKPFVQAENYITKPKIRAWVLQRILRHLPPTGRVVIVGHSLGSVIAADLLRRLPTDLEIAGLITIGSPLAHESFHVDGLRDLLAEPPSNLAWWVNCWSTADPVPTHRGLSSAFPWVLDQRLSTPLDLNPVRAHRAVTYLANHTVARAIGRGLFGSQSKAVAIPERGLDIPLDYSETFALMALRYAHLINQELEGDRRERYAEALRQVQSTTVEQIRARNMKEGRPMPLAVSTLAVDLSDPDSRPAVPEAPGHLSIEEAVVPLAVVAGVNVIRPYEIEIPQDKREKAMRQLTLEMKLGRQVGTNVFEALEAAKKVLKGPTNWFKWTALGLGTAAVVAATGGLALAAAPGVAGAAAVTSALAAFGPGGMIGGLLTAGTLVSVGGGGIAMGLAAPGTSAEAVEAVVEGQLTTVILRALQGLEQDPQTWSSMAEAEIAVTRQLARLKPVSDESAPTVKELQRKRDTIDRALDFLQRYSPELQRSDPSASGA